MHHPAAAAVGVALYCKRDDLYGWERGSPLQGNKVRKLLPLLQRPDLPGRTVVSFGGAYSNHVAALGAAGRRFGFTTRFFIRGEAVRNPMLDQVRKGGSELHFLSRSTYRRKHEPAVLASLGIGPGELLIPEGGTTPAALSTTSEIFREVCTQLGHAPDYLCVSAGTGGTAAGITAAAHGSPTHVEVYPALKGNWMGRQLMYLLEGREATENLEVVTEYHGGGYGKFLPRWSIHTPPGAGAKRADIGEAGLPPLEPVYTAKLFTGVLDRLVRGCYPAGSEVVVVHTGGIY